MLGLILLALSVLAVVGCLAAAAYGHTGWAIAMGGSAVAGGTAGMAWLLVESRRVRRLEATRLSGGHEGRPDDTTSGPL
ncbi:MAG TPA: hypothetical protein VFW69_18375 [Mycobacterium sp.]|nr:hypothetical protein [Mycobacterium sp.]